MSPWRRARTGSPRRRDAAHDAAAKVEATREYGASIVLHGDSYDEARAEAERLSREQQLTTIPAFDDARIVAGQGTCGLEIVEDAPDIDTVIVPVGGGGLIAGIAIAVKAHASQTRIIGVQAEAAPGVARSFAAGARTAVATRRRSLKASR